MKCPIYIYLLLVVLMHDFKALKSQSVVNGFRYQTVVRDASGLEVINQTMGVKSSIYSGSSSGLLVWEETFVLNTDSRGLLKFIIGSGSSTGAGALSSFSSINFGANTYFIKISIDVNGGSSYVGVGSAQLLSVPYAFYAIKSDKITNYYLNQLSDVNTPSPTFGKLLKWGGMYWIAGVDNDSDSSMYAFNTFQSFCSDTSYYSYSSLSLDSVLYSFHSDTAQYSFSAINSVNSNHANNSDTALYAFTSPPFAWTLSGNNLNVNFSYLGTSDTKDLLFKANNSTVLQVKSTGNIYVGAASGMFDLSIYGTDGLLFNGIFGSGTISVSGAGSRMYWYPARASFRVGAVSANQWDDSNIGNYSFAAGYNCIAGPFAFASGNYCVSSGDYGVAIGRKSQATAVGVYPSGVSIAIGDSSVASTPRSVAIGRGNLASTNNAAIAIGFFNRASGAISTAMGFRTIASGNYSFVLGFYASSNSRTGSFVYADASSSVITNSTANNQFMIRASGGVLFYSDPVNTMGAFLPSGGGSWASISDINKKENFKILNSEIVLKKVEEIKITTWNYKSQNSSVKHIGPMAQDFYKAFSLGNDNKTISIVDIDGVTLLGIKGLVKRIHELSPLLEINDIKIKSEVLGNFELLNKRLDELELKISEHNIEQLKK